jgi:mono/diheme cytochrome c family protein
MRWWTSVVVLLAVVAGLRPGVARAGPAPPARDIGDEVRRVFATKCAGCHGPDLEKPKGRFGYVLDLRRVAGNPEMVIPGRPTESELWVLVREDEMPPAGAPRGALAPEQKEVIRAWIAAGAPYPAPRASADRILRRLGKFHLLLLHFPIALVVAVGFGEVLSIWRRDPLPSGSVRFCLWLGALTAIPTAGLGWLHAADGNGPGSSQLLTAHRWLGTTAAAWLVIAAVRVERDARGGVRSRAAWLLMTSGVLATALTAHLGGLLDRGGDFFNY